MDLDVVHLFSRLYKVTFPTIKVYLSGVRSLHINNGFPDPLKDRPRLQRVLRGIKRSQGSSSTNRLPIDKSILLLIHNHLNLSVPDHLMFWAACALAFFGFLRASEFTVDSLASFHPDYHLSPQDIFVDSAASPSCLKVLIKASKTDPFREGCAIFIGSSLSPICAVKAVLDYLAVRGFSQGPLFLLSSGRLLSSNILTSWLRSILRSAGITGNYSSHSFRIGAATSAAKAGIPETLIQALGRWESSAYQRYIRLDCNSIKEVAQKL